MNGQRGASFSERSIERLRRTPTFEGEFVRNGGRTLRVRDGARCSSSSSRRIARTLTLTAPVMPCAERSQKPSI